MPTIFKNRTFSFGHAVGDMWKGKENEGKFWAVQNENREMHLNPSGEVQFGAYWFDTQEELAEAEKRYASKHRTKDWHNELACLVSDCIRDQRNGMDVLASSSWDRVVDHWGDHPCP